ncbi:MAG: hypothetical protein JKY81_05775 [Colwellia sp.]|nr:hypothetical protein [Colwellia sp.]
MNLKLTIKNWRWWVVVPFALPILLVISIPAGIIFILELLIAAVELVNFGNRHSMVGRRILAWVHGN